MNTLYALIQITECSHAPILERNIIAYSHNQTKLEELSKNLPALRAKADCDKRDIKAQTETEFAKRAGISEGIQTRDLLKELKKKGLSDEFHNTHLERKKKYEKSLGYSLKEPYIMEEFEIEEITIL